MRARAGTAAANQHSQAAPMGATGASESDHLMRAMTAVLARQCPASGAEALRDLRRGFPTARWRCGSPRSAH